MWRQAALLVCLMTCSIALGDDLQSYDSIKRLRRANFRTQHPFSAYVVLPKVQLFIGVLSVHADRRAAIRESWGRLATRDYGVVLRFFTSRDEAAGSQEEECYDSNAGLEPTQCEDMVYVGENLLDGQNGVTQKVYLLFEHAVTYFDPAFVMKADDDTFVNIPVVLSVLAAQTSSRSAVYFGRVAKGPDLSGLKEDDLDSPFVSYLEDTLRRSALPIYAAGPGYVITGSAVKAVVAVNNLVGLRHNFHEDTAVGVWLSGLLIRFVSHEEAGVDIIDSMEVGRDPDPEQGRFCLDAEGLPISWVHGLKNPGDMQHISALAQSCMDTWEEGASASPDNH